MLEHIKINYFLQLLGLLADYTLFSPQLPEQFQMSNTSPRTGHSSFLHARLDFPLSFHHQDVATSTRIRSHQSLGTG